MKKRMQITIPRKHPAAMAACGLFVLAAAVRLYYYLPRLTDTMTFWVHLCMPVTAAVIFLVGMALGGKFVKPGVMIATVLGVAFFIIKATTFTPVHQTLCTILYLTVLMLFTSTVLGWLPTKKLLYPLFGLPLLYHILVEDTQAYFFAQPPVPVIHWLPEISVLCIMAALFCQAFAMVTEP